MSKYAVLIPLVNTDGGDALLMELRSQKVRQPGEVCFPGGRAEPGETAVEAAVRETCEELGVTPDMIEVLGELKPLVMGDGREVLPEKLLGYLARYGDYRHRGKTDYIEYEGYGIWGLTARILRDYFGQI